MSDLRQVERGYCGTRTPQPLACSYPLTACWVSCCQIIGGGDWKGGRRVRRAAVGRWAGKRFVPCQFSQERESSPAPLGLGARRAHHNSSVMGDFLVSPRGIDIIAQLSCHLQRSEQASLLQNTHPSSPFLYDVQRFFMRPVLNSSTNNNPLQLRVRLVNYPFPLSHNVHRAGFRPSPYTETKCGEGPARASQRPPQDSGVSLAALNTDPKAPALPSVIPPGKGRRKQQDVRGTWILGVRL